MTCVADDRAVLPSFSSEDRRRDPTTARNAGRLAAAPRCFFPLTPSAALVYGAAATGARVRVRRPPIDCRLSPDRRLLIAARTPNAALSALAEPALSALPLLRTVRRRIKPALRVPKHSQHTHSHTTQHIP